MAHFGTNSSPWEDIRTNVTPGKQSDANIRGRSGGFACIHRSQVSQRWKRVLLTCFFFDSEKTNVGVGLHLLEGGGRGFRLLGVLGR